MKSTQRTKDYHNYCTLYIVRHGETEWNLKRIIQGHQDSSLTKRGEKQVKALAKIMKNIKFDAIFSSDLMRAKHSAEAIALEHKLAVTTNKMLRERKFGSFEGKRIEKYNKDLRKMLKKRAQLPSKKRYSFKLAADIESDEELISRFITFIRETAVAYPGKKVLLVCHGGAMRAILVHLGFAKYEELPFGSIENTAFIKLTSDGVDFFIKETFGINKSNVK